MRESVTSSQITSKEAGWVKKTSFYVLKPRKKERLEKRRFSFALISKNEYVHLEKWGGLISFTWYNCSDTKRLRLKKMIVGNGPPCMFGSVRCCLGPDFLENKLSRSLNFFSHERNWDKKTFAKFWFLIDIEDQYTICNTYKQCRFYYFSHKRN